MTMIPAPGTVLDDDSTDPALVVATPDADVVDAILTLVEAEYGGERFSRENAAIKAATASISVECWHPLSTERAAAAGIEQDPDAPFWGPDGDGAEAMYVVPLPMSAYLLGELAEESEAGRSDGAETSEAAPNAPRLASIDQDAEEGRYCPACGADWRAGEIPRESLAAGFYGHRSPCARRQSFESDYDPAVPCTCPPRHFSRLVGIETKRYDGVSYWQCPDCGTTWDRWTREVANDVV